MPKQVKAIKDDNINTQKKKWIPAQNDLFLFHPHPSLPGDSLNTAQYNHQVSLLVKYSALTFWSAPIKTCANKIVFLLRVSLLSSADCYMVRALQTRIIHINAHKERFKFVWFEYFDELDWGAINAHRSDVKMFTAIWQIPMSNKTLNAAPFMPNSFLNNRWCCLSISKIMSHTSIPLTYHTRLLYYTRYR